jgi:hypothetical protein
MSTIDDTKDDNGADKKTPRFRVDSDFRSQKNSEVVCYVVKTASLALSSENIRTDFTLEIVKTSCKWWFKTNSDLSVELQRRYHNEIIDFCSMDTESLSLTEFASRLNKPVEEVYVSIMSGICVYVRNTMSDDEYKIRQDAIKASYPKGEVLCGVTAPKVLGVTEDDTVIFEGDIPPTDSFVSSFQKLLSSKDAEAPTADKVE